MFKLDALPYSYDALDPYIDAQTMELHYSKHHQGYVTNLNKALEKFPQLQGHLITDLLQNLDELPEDVRAAVRNHGGGHYNHTLFWQMMKPNVKMSKGKLYEVLSERFDSFDRFKEIFENAAKSQFGSGWAWLVIDKQSGELEVCSTANQDSPISYGKVILLGLDVWEHAYYLKYQNKRPDYIAAWWNVVNWEYVEENYRQILGS